MVSQVVTCSRSSSDTEARVLYCDIPALEEQRRHRLYTSGTCPQWCKSELDGSLELPCDVLPWLRIVMCRSMILYIVDTVLGIASVFEMT
jgi:hypothetical protein